MTSYAHTWYDMAGRVVATANYGTNDELQRFHTGPEPSYDPLTPPVVRTTEGIITGVNYLGMSSGVVLSAYEYDDAGRQTAIFHPNHTTTRTEYDGLGRVRLVRENADSPNGVIQRTAYKYDEKGQLTHIAAVMPGHSEGGVTTYGQINWDATDGSLQVTQIYYGAAVVNSTGTNISANNSLIHEVRFPHPLTGQPRPTDALLFTYYSDGSVASRTDARGVTFRHAYDELGRRTDTTIDENSWYGDTMAPFAPPWRISRIEYHYDLASGDLERVTAHTQTSSGVAILAENRYEFDELHRLKKEHQAHGGAVTMGTTPATQYTWDFSPQYNFDRLVGMTYPIRVQGGGSRVISFDYGNNADDIDSSTGRVTAIEDIALGDLISDYDYAGTSRRVRTQWGNAMTQSVWDTTGVYAGLNNHGRLKDLHYLKGNSSTIHRYQYGYDKAGNRTYARVTHADTSGIPHDNDRSSLYTYDALNRLIETSMGKLDLGGEQPIIAIPAPSPLPQHTTWALDNLGNWSGGTGTPTWSFTQTGDFDGNGTVDPPRSTHHVVDHSNRLNTVERSFAPTTTTIVNDPNGSLTFDGAYYYQYDAWNRLIQVNQIGTAEVAVDGRILPDSGTLGDLVVRYRYDGLGRLIRKDTPVNRGSTYLQTKDYYYDGVRRIQEVIDRPDPDDTSTGDDGDTKNDEQPLDVDSDGDGIPDDQDQDILGTGTTGADDDGEGGGDPGTTPGQRWTEREYVYSPKYVDEFVCQITYEPPSANAGIAGAIVYMLQDGCYNVVGLVSGSPAGTCAGSSSSWGPAGAPLPGTLLAQYVYESYGRVAQADHFQPHPVNRVAHQGLFFERFDGSYDEWQVVTTDQGLYYNRNRFYSHVLGRFTTRDPHESGMPINYDMTMGGEAVRTRASPIIVEAMYGSGMSLLEYEGSAPTISLDPLGLDQDNHVYPLYLGGGSEGPGITLADDEHTEFHRELRKQLKGGSWEAQRTRWKGMSKSERIAALTFAYEAAGIDIGSEEFKAMIKEAYASSAEHGVKSERKAISKFHSVPRAPKGGARGAVFSKIKGANAAAALTKAGVVASAALAVTPLLSFYNISGNDNLRNLQAATMRARYSGGLSTADEAFGYVDFMELTQDPVAASTAWLMWGDALNSGPQ